MPSYIMALDQGTTSSRAALFDKEQNITAMCQRELAQYYPREGWVEHDPMEIYSSQYSVMMEVIAKSGIKASDILAIGITNQRETTVLWDKNTGKPVYNAIVWQCRRTADLVDDLKKRGLSQYITEVTGLIPDAYFSATKIKWLLDNVPGLREKAERGELLFGTVDTWLIWKLTEGSVHVTDRTNAARTMLFDIKNLTWDERLLKELGIPAGILPEVRSSSEIYGYTNIGGMEIPIAGCAGDQQAALFGQCCFEEGQVKNTYGTGCFLLMNTGDKICRNNSGLITTLAATGKDEIKYALEGSVFSGGSVIQWLRDELRFFSESGDASYYADKVSDTGGVYIVPAFTGLGAPYWDMGARGTITGITRGTKREHIIRAAEECIAYQSLDLIRAMEEARGGKKISVLKTDGGASKDNFLMKFQADIINGEIERSAGAETTALGASLLAGLAVGFWSNQNEILRNKKPGVAFTPDMGEERRDKLIKGWHEAVRKTILL